MSNRLGAIHECDGQTDGRMDGRRDILIGYAALRLLLLLLLLLLLHDLYSANFEDRVGGVGVARWRT